MTLPSVTITELDGALGVMPPSAGFLYAVVGVAAAGPYNTPATFARVLDVRRTFAGGPMVEAAAHYIERYGRPVICVRLTEGGPGIVGTATQIATTGAGAQPTVSVDNSSAIYDDANIVFRVVTGGTLGVAGITYQYSDDGGRTWSPVRALGTAVRIDVTNLDPFILPQPTVWPAADRSHVSFLLGAGAYNAGSAWSVPCQAPGFDATALAAALTALGNSAVSWELVHVAGAIDADMVDTLDGAIATMVARGKFRAWIANTRLLRIGVEGLSGYTVSNNQHTGDSEGASGTSEATYDATGATGTELIYIKVINGTTIGTVGAPTAKYALSPDGGSTFGSAVTLSGNTITLPSGVVVTFSNGTFAVGDVYQAEVDEAFSADDETETQYMASLGASFGQKSTVYGMVCAGACRMASGINGHRQRRPISFAIAAREASVSAEVDTADPTLGPLPSVSIVDVNGNPAEHDEATSPGLDDLRFTTLRSIDGYQGAYVTRPRLLAPTGSDFYIMPYRRVLNLVRAALRVYFIRRLNHPVLVSKSTGYIQESEAREIELGAIAAMRAAVLAKPMASDVDFVLSRTDNVLSTRTLTGQARVIPLSYPEFIDIEVGFLNPALQVNAS